MRGNTVPDAQWKRQKGKEFYGYQENQFLFSRGGNITVEMMGIPAALPTILQTCPEPSKDNTRVRESEALEDKTQGEINKHCVLLPLTFPNPGGATPVQWPPPRSTALGVWKMKRKLRGPNVPSPQAHQSCAEHPLPCEASASGPLEGRAGPAPNSERYQHA